MITRPRVLLLEDTRTEREELRDLFTDIGLEVWPTSSPLRAREWMKANGAYDFAVIDWDMARSEDADEEPTSRLVLEKLARSRDTLTLVHAGDLSGVKTQEAIQRAHPHALLHDKVRGTRSLQDRIMSLLSRPVGDIALDSGDHSRVVHLPTDNVFRHRIGFRLLTHYPKPVMVPRENRGMYSGLYRFKQWLETCESVVSVELRGNRSQRYSLVVRED